MKKILLVAFLFFFGMSLHAQKITVGSVFTIAKVKNQNYQHINVPKKNFIVKKGGIANYKSLAGKEVEIVSTRKKKNGDVEATIQLTSKNLFFNSHKYLTVAIKDAVADRELVVK